MAQAVDDLARNIFFKTVTFVDLRNIFDMVCRIIFGDEVYGLGLDAQVDVLGDQGHDALGIFLGKAECAVEYLVVRLVGFKVELEVIVEFLVEFDDQKPFVLADGDTAVKDPFRRDLVEFLEEVARVEIEGFVTLLEFVQLFNNGDRDDDVVFFKLVQACAVVQDDVGVQDK